MVRLKVEAAMLGYEAISAKDNEFVLTVRRTIVPNRIVLYRRFRNEARVQQGVIRIPRRLLGSRRMQQLRALFPPITTPPHSHPLSKPTSSSYPHLSPTPIHPL